MAADPAEHRDEAAERRDDLALSRDHSGEARDGTAVARDLVSGQRDAAAHLRDAAAELRDATASRDERQADARSLPSAGSAAATLRAQQARHAAATDRRSASQDRRAGAGERALAGQDRSTAMHDRTSAASERDRAGEDRAASERDRHDASLDGLTGAYVRGAGLRQLERELHRAQRTGQLLAVAFVDVDRLKAVNDVGGHAAGDRLLAAVSAALRRRLRPYDLVIRYGGDEFVGVLSGLGRVETEQRLALVNADLHPHGSVSFGVVEGTAHEDAAAVLARADAALYARRAETRNPPRG